MASITMYTSQYCPFCKRAEQLLESKKVSINRVDVGQDSEQRLIMIERSGRHTVPQIFINNQHIGGCQELENLEQTGHLDTLLST